MKKIFLIAIDTFGQAWRSFKKEFEKMWYKVEGYNNFIQYFPQTKRKGILSKFAGGMNLLINTIRVNFFFPWKRLKTFNPDIILVFKWTNFYCSTIKKIKKKQTNSLFWNRNADNPFADYNTSMSYLKSIKYYDFHITFAKHLKKTLETVWAKKVIWLPFRHDPSLMPSNTSITDMDKKKYNCDVLFVGTWDKKRERILSKICDKFDVKIFWNNWDRAKNKAIKDSIQSKAIYWKEIVKAFKIAKINLNILRTQNKYSHNLRNMEVPWCGWVLLTERSNEIEELFKDNKQIFYRKNEENISIKVKEIINQKVIKSKTEEYSLWRILEEFIISIK